MTELAGVIVGNYFLLECLAREGIVETYRARPILQGGYDVCLRLFRPRFPDPTLFREHFACEIEKVWGCRHPHILPLLEFGTGDDLLYCVTECPETEMMKTLKSHLLCQYESPLPLSWVVRIIVQVCSAVQYAHEHDIVHGNIQPSSIVLRGDGHVLLTDFGMRPPSEENEPLVMMLDEGNPAYRAPEQALGMVTAMSDIYALGVLLYQLVCKALPYAGGSAADIALKHANEPIPLLRAHRPELPEAVEAVVRVAMAKRSSARFSTAKELAQALVAAVEPKSYEIQCLTPQLRIPVKARRTAFTWTRARSILRSRSYF